MYEETYAQVDFPTATCTLDAETDSLVLRVTAERVETVTRLERIVERQLRRCIQGTEAMAIAWAPVAGL